MQQLSTRIPLFTAVKIFVVSIWILITTFVFLVDSDSELMCSWIVTIPGGWLMVYLSFRWLLPTSLNRRFPVLFYIGCVTLYCIVIFLGTCMVLAMYIENEDFFISMTAISFFTLLLVQAPLQWFIFRNSRNDAELVVLRKELGQSEANIDLLRSQINPHFLFNTLNTIYGIALQEKAERTSEGIEKLGSMMRFMLRENVQEKISLSREIEYLRSYISLQRLRTDNIAAIRIDVVIQNDINSDIQIAPMLLIPFVENAFKYGISLRKESHINIALAITEHSLYFDVFNTRHARADADPEKNSNGIGLLNVRQRLQLLYPLRHELVIQQTPKDYSVHLVINLDV